MRKRYGGFLSQRFNSKEVTIKSTNCNRIIKTAQSIVSGLYKPKEAENWDEKTAPLPTPIATLDQIWIDIPKCARYEQLLSHAYKTEEFINANNYYKVELHIFNIKNKLIWNQGLIDNQIKILIIKKWKLNK